MQTPTHRSLSTYAILLMLMAVIGALATPGRTAVAAGTATQGSDCNGLGAGAAAGSVPNYGCTEIRRSKSGERVEVNGSYVGHDEPLVAYYSDKPGSGNDVQFRVKLPIDPPKPPSGTLTGNVSTFQLYPAFWFSMILCDSESFPEGTKTCRPDSDSNVQVPFNGTHAGTAVLEMQFFPPGWSPFVTQLSCDQTHWCAALHINSLQANFDFSQVNENCIEPTTFAWIQRNGSPTGPAGPDNLS